MKLTVNIRNRLATLVAALLLPAAGLAAGFELEWAFLEGAARTRLVERLTEDGRTNEVALLAALADQDAVRSELALRALFEESGDWRLGRGLVRLLNASGRGAEAQEVERSLRKRRGTQRKLKAVSPAVPRFSGKTPMVFLHGYNGNADTWSDFLPLFLSDLGGYGDGDIIVFQYYDDTDNSSGLTAGLTTFGGNVDTKISELAERVESAVTVWLRRRSQMIYGVELPDDQLPAVDWVCHSMGGLVFRNVLRDRPELVRRCVTLGTPHFGQAIGANVVVGQLVGKQAHEMAFGSTMLWNLAADWHFLGKRTDDILFVVGVAAEDETGTGSYHDGLIQAFSATMQTAEDARFVSRTYFVNRIHSTVLGVVYPDVRALPELSGPDDPLFRLVRDYFGDSGDFADGAHPSQEQVLTADGCADASARLTNLVRRGALFVQVMDGVTNTADRTEKPVEYDSGYFTPDTVVDSLTFGSRIYKDRKDGLVRENGYNDEGCESGLVMLFGNLPTGDCTAQIGRPYLTSRPIYNDVFHLAGGGTTLVRTRPGGARPMCAVQIADIDGCSRSVVVANDWLAANGQVNHAENLKACVTAAAAEGANGYPVAVSSVLGLSPADAESTLKITSMKVGEPLSFSVAAGGRPLEPGTDPVALQAKDRLDDANWRTVESPDGSWTLPFSSGRFFRAVLRWQPDSTRPR